MESLVTFGRSALFATLCYAVSAFFCKSYRQLTCAQALLYVASLVTEVSSDVYWQPFRSEDRKELIAETTKARLEFTPRYWKNVSEEAKDFIKTLVRPDPADRPTAEEALRHKVRYSLYMGHDG